MEHYNFEIAVSAKISAKVVEEMIKRVVEEQTGKKVSSIEMKFNTVSKGIGPSESTERVFDGCHVFFQSEKPTATNNSRGFVKATYE